MLEERWRQTVVTHANETALGELSTGRGWTFTQLAAAADASLIRSGEPIVYPVGNEAEFVLEVLRAWRAGLVVCPREPIAAVPAIPRPPAGIAHLKLTSGTTGLPKCIAFTAAQLAADADAIVATMGLQSDRPNLAVVSLAHSYGFSNLVLPLLLHGIPLILAASPLPDAVRAAAQSWGTTPLTLPAVPAMWRAWHDAGAIPRNVELAISAGAPLPLSLETAVFAASGLKLHNFLGASECGGIAYDASSIPRTDAARVGTPLLDVELATSVEGCLEVRGPAVGTSYWPDRSEPLSDGVFRTSDLVELGDDGAVYLRGRASDLINVAGRKLAPESVETVLRQHPAVRECLVLGLPTEDPRGETVAAVVELAEVVDEVVLRDFLLRRLPAWQVPRVWWPVESLSPNHRGKLSRRDWRERFLNSRLSLES